MTFDQITVVGFLTVGASYLIKLIGFPQQAYKIYKSKSGQNVSTFLYIFSFISYCLWTYYGYLKKDYFVMWGQALGIITTGIIVILLNKYKDDKDNENKQSGT
jgi:MtN3 and saliva related transmembrane protein